MSRPLYKHYFRHNVPGDHFSDWSLTSMEPLWSGKKTPCPRCGVDGHFYRKTTKALGVGPSPLEFQTQEERIRVVALMKYQTSIISMALAQIVNVKQKYPDFIKEHYDQLPKYSMQELGDWIKASNQADDHLVDRAVLFGRPWDPALGKEVKNEPGSS